MNSQHVCLGILVSSVPVVAIYRSNLANVTAPYVSFSSSSSLNRVFDFTLWLQDICIHVLFLREFLSVFMN
ncbi:hypothetical protein EDD16DRAFT_1537082 [Pisolithus croceorrhizus]|nr:hypothetical protein EDD16DRAFT_1537082 [Pisolithus croceorrhizus]